MRWIWKSTALLEMCGERFQHVGTRQPVNDAYDFCIIGGGRANVLAALELFRRRDANVFLFAYGHRSEYLQRLNAPSESEVMSDEFERLGRRYGVQSVTHRFPREHGVKAPSNSFQELRNVLDFALRHGCNVVTIVTIGVHCPRARVFLDAAVREKKEYSRLRVEVRATEDILRARSPRFDSILCRMEKSRAYARNAARERQGIEDFKAGRYKPVTAV